jgi:hypothetical protein
VLKTNVHYIASKNTGSNTFSNYFKLFVLLNLVFFFFVVLLLLVYFPSCVTAGGAAAAAPVAPRERRGARI